MDHHNNNKNNNNNNIQSSSIPTTKSNNSPSKFRLSLKKRRRKNMEHLSPTNQTISNVNTLKVTKNMSKNNRRSHDHMDDVDISSKIDANILSTSQITTIQCKLCNKEKSDYSTKKTTTTIDNTEQAQQQQQQMMKKRIKRSSQIDDSNQQQNIDDNQHHQDDNDEQQQQQNHYCCRHQKRIPSNRANIFQNHQPYCCLYGSASSFDRATSVTIARLEPFRDQPSSNLLEQQCSDSDQVLSAKQNLIDSSSKQDIPDFINNESSSLANQMINNKMNNNNNNNKQLTIATKMFDQSFIQFGRMNIEMKNPKLLLVFNDKYNNHAKWLFEAGNLAGFSCIDLPIFDPLNLCRSIRDIKGNEFTIVIALMNKNFYYNDQQQQQQQLIDIYKSGFNRCIPETFSQDCGYYHYELIQLRQFELQLQMKLRAAQTMMMAIDSCKEGVVITGPSHDIRYVNHSIEKMFGFRADDMIGQKTQDFFQNDLIKMEVDEKINNYNDGKEWEGQIYHRRKSGESIPIWNRIMPINYRKGVPEYIIYIKEFPFLFVDKLMSPEREFHTSHGSLATSSSPNSTITTAAAARSAYRKMSTIDVRSEARRPSLAKFNSVSMIEAPITKVINILMAIKESGPVFLAPTLEKAIDILKNSEVFNKFQNQMKPEDQVTSELISSLMNTANKPSNSGTRRMSHDVPSSISSSHNKNNASYHLTQTMSTPAYSSSQSHLHYHHHHHHHQSSLSMIVPANIQKLLEDDLKWNFNVIELERISENRPLLWLGNSIFDRFNVLQTLNCSRTVAQNWLSLIESKYRKNSYHNSTHAADVMQATAYFLMSERLKTLFDPLDQAICLIAAIIHDVDHPGRNSAFLSNSNHELAVLYNDISVLESHHAAYAFRLTVLGPDSDRVNIFKNLDRETYRECRQSIIDMVLATEMTKHFEHLTKFVRTFQSFNIVDDEQLTINLDKYKNIDVDDDDDNISTTTTVSDLATPENIVLIKPFGNFTEMIENMNINYQYWKDKLPIAEPRSRKVSESADDIKEVDEENNNDMTS
ncbi:High affinity cAMP-specific and IBMX-insensitive 3',5'-cyclic phosphodiesterase 8B [Dermatophagoides pteronyssinus]|uniref:3',5'-cyclic-AMP phosphodiesterase n=1 Tax=Dermatophagoides pteronyssinus TaxID=6956 RepID=A0ABQ8IYY1_DERPT|nr:High affinity cAMP-specific and IBMX-insensitive 3',5'-cyclic phosphodiesterase 8B [Dermatophagoides pteronyssinus]